MNQILLVVAVLVLAVIVVGLVLLVWRQARQIKQLTTPRYGFLGKPLYAMVLVGSTFGVYAGGLVNNFVGTPVSTFVEGQIASNFRMNYSLTNQNDVELELYYAGELDTIVKANEKYTLTLTVVDQQGAVVLSSPSAEYDFARLVRLPVQLKSGQEYYAEAKVEHNSKVFYSLLKITLP